MHRGNHKVNYGLTLLENIINVVIYNKANSFLNLAGIIFSKIQKYMNKALFKNMWPITS